MNRREVLALALGTMSGSLTGRAAAGPPPLRIVTAHLPPLVMAPGGAQAGAVRELVDALCQRLDLAPQLEFVPWRRALYLATHMKHTAIVPLTRNPEREGQFRWLAPVYEENYIFMAQQGSSFDVDHPQAMRDKRVTLLRGAGQASILADLGFRHMVEASSVDEVHRFLLAGMADAVFGERAIIQSSLALRGHEMHFRLGRPVRTTSAWLAGSLDFGEAEAERYRSAMAALADDGTQARIFRRYGIA